MKITYADRDHFTSGECHSLAIQLHRMTGWPIAVVHLDWHAFVIPAPRLALDADGISTSRKVSIDWGGGRSRRVTEGYFVEHGWSKPVFTSRTRRVAEELIRIVREAGL